MLGDIELFGRLSVQDRDLLGRLNRYFDALDTHLRDGEGWFIFGVAGSRGQRIVKLIGDRLADYQPLVSYYFVPWRDFALSAYMHEVELAARREQRGVISEKLRQEYDIAQRVSRDTYYVMAGCDLLIVSGLAPSHRHELHFLDKLLEGRHGRRHPSILLTPRKLEELAADFTTLDQSSVYWERLFTRMYQSSLMAL